jgi:hypothetical protein
LGRLALQNAWAGLRPWPVDVVGGKLWENSGMGAVSALRPSVDPREMATLLASRA